MKRFNTLKIVLLKIWKIENGVVETLFSKNNYCDKYCWLLVVGTIFVFPNTQLLWMSILVNCFSHFGNLIMDENFDYPGGSGTIQAIWTMDELRDIRSVVELKDDGENSRYLSWIIKRFTINWTQKKSKHYNFLIT